MKPWNITIFKCSNLFLINAREFISDKCAGGIMFVENGPGEPRSNPELGSLRFSEF